MNKVKTVILFGILFLSAWACSTPGAMKILHDHSYPLENVQDDLLDGADALTRHYERRIEFIDDSRAVTTVRFSVTVLNKDGRDRGRLHLQYDKLRQIEYVRGSLRDGKGNLIRNISDGDMNDFKATNSISLYDDNRVKTYQLYHGSYPYTVEYEYRLRHDGYIGFSNMSFQKFREGIEFAKFEIKYPRRMKVNHLVENEEPAIDMDTTANKYIKRFTYRDLPPIKKEKFGPPSSTYLPQLSVTPNRFQIEDTNGSFTSWEAFGRWYYKLGKGRQELSNNIKAEVDVLLEGVEDDAHKLEILYNYLQEKTRYVSVQLGIGGWQPFDARYVGNNQYGDCKALTNFMMSLAKYADITTYPVLINNGLSTQYEVRPDFPNNAFNHVVLMAPLEEDTLWMENTSSTTAFGNVGLSNENRYGLAITPEGGRLVQTPSKAYVENQQLNTVHHKINSDGSAHSQVQTSYTGNQQEYIRQMLSMKNNKEREKWLRNSVNLNNARFVKIDFSDPGQKESSYDLSFEVELPQLASRMGSRLFIPLNSFNRWNLRFSEPEKRKRDIFLPFTYHDSDSTLIKIPSGFDIESMPEPVYIDNDFLTYTSQIVRKDDETLLYTRTVGLKIKRIPKEEYQQAKVAFNEIWKSDRGKIVAREI